MGKRRSAGELDPRSFRYGVSHSFVVYSTERDRWEGELHHTTKDGSQLTVASRWTTLREGSGKPVGWLEINTDITARKRAEEAARGLSGRILTLQDDERRRIARELHDSLGQYLAALKMSLNLLQASKDNKAKTYADCSEIVDKCLTETRTISHHSASAVIGRRRFWLCCSLVCGRLRPAQQHQGEPKSNAKTWSAAQGHGNRTFSRGARSSHECPSSFGRVSG